MAQNSDTLSKSRDQRSDSVARTPRRMNDERDFLNPVPAATNEITIRSVSPPYRDGDFSKLVKLRKMHQKALDMIKRLQDSELYKVSCTEEKNIVTDLQNQHKIFIGELDGKIGNQDQNNIDWWGDRSQGRKKTRTISPITSTQ